MSLFLMQNTSLSELCFPKADAAQGAKTLKRQVTIPTTFPSTAHYKEAFTAVITGIFLFVYQINQRM